MTNTRPELPQKTLEDGIKKSRQVDMLEWMDYMRSKTAPKDSAPQEGPEDTHAEPIKNRL